MRISRLWWQSSNAWKQSDPRLTLQGTELSLTWLSTPRKFSSPSVFSATVTGSKGTGRTISTLSTTSVAMVTSSGSLIRRTRSISLSLTIASLKSRSTITSSTAQPSSWVSTLCRSLNQVTRSQDVETNAFPITSLLRSRIETTHMMAWSNTKPVAKEAF